MSLHIVCHYDMTYRLNKCGRYSGKQDNHYHCVTIDNK